jgi:DNA repair protein RadC
MLIREIPEGDRPREKLMARGASALTDTELLAIFLRTGRKGKSALALATELLAWKGSLLELSRARPDDIVAAVSGIGAAKAAELCAATELANRLARAGVERPLLDHPQAAYELFAPQMRSHDREVVKVVLLDTKLRMTREEDIARGTLNECCAHPRDIFRHAVAHGAYGILLLHNHPSGDPAPSRADQSLTRQLIEGARLLNLHLLDHIIIGTPEGGRQPFFSFREAGLL